MPSNAVAIKPMWCLPGTINRAIAPTIRPRMIIQMMCKTMTSSFVCLTLVGRITQPYQLKMKDFHHCRRIASAHEWVTDNPEEGRGDARHRHHRVRTAIGGDASAVRLGSGAAHCHR